MGDGAVFCFLLEKGFNLDKFKKLLNFVVGENFRGDDVKYELIGKPSHVYDYYDNVAKISTYFWWYPNENKLRLRVNVSFIPGWIHCRKLIKKIYPLLKLGGFGYDSGISTKGEEDEMLVEGRTPEKESRLRIWVVNLFTLEEVERYGREKLLKAPCEVIEEWDDGAIFMMIHKNSFSSSVKEREKLRQYLEKP